MQTLARGNIRRWIVTLSHNITIFPRFSEKLKCLTFSLQNTGSEAVREPNKLKERL